MAYDAALQPVLMRTRQRDPRIKSEDDGQKGGRPLYPFNVPSKNATALAQASVAASGV